MTSEALPSPELLGLPVATLALLVSLLSFAIAVGTLIWQVIKHVLDGGRVRVYLNTAIWEPGFMIATNRSGHFILQDDQAARSVAHGRALELAQLVVENPGRLPVTIHSPGLAFSGHGEKDHSVVPRMFATDGTFGVDDAVATSVVRLEPYGRVTFLLDCWSVFPSVLKDAPGGEVIVRGQVGVAGRPRKPQKSSWRRRWKIRQGMYTAIEGSPRFTPFSVIWGVMYRHLPTYEEAERDRHPQSGTPFTRENVQYAVDAAMSRFNQRPELELLSAALEEAAEKRGDRFPSFGLSVLNAYEALDRMNGHLTEWTDGLLTRRRDSGESKGSPESGPG